MDQTLIDLDATPEALAENDARENLYILFGLYYLLGLCDYPTWQRATRYYAYYMYILPDDRTLSDLLCDMIWKKHCKNATAIYMFLTAIKNIEAHYTDAQQARMAGILIGNRQMEGWKKSPKSVV